MNRPFLKPEQVSNSGPNNQPSYEPLEWRDEPDFEIGFKWLGRTSIPVQEMSRHWLILGETGCGKTRSGVIPLFNALIRYGC